MQIGRKIYYELATGNVIVETGERQGSVVETTQDQDFAMYEALQPYQQTAVGCLQLEFGQDAQNFGTYPFHVDITQNPPVIAWDTAPTTSLSTAQQQKNAQLEDLCSQSLQTFQSDALHPGTMATYLSDSDSMSLLNGEYSFVNGPDYNGTDAIPWFVVGQGYVNHTAAQFRKVYTDGRAWFQSQKVKKSQLEAQVTAAMTVDAVNAITW